MPASVCVVVEHLGGKPAEVSFELLGKGRELADALGIECCAVVLAKDARGVAERCGVADSALYVEHEGLASFTPEAHAKALAATLRPRGPRIVLVSNSSKGMDVAPNLALALGVPLVTNVCAVSVEGGKIVAISQLYGGKVFVEAEVEGDRAVLSILAGASSAEAGKSDKPAEIQLVEEVLDLSSVGTTFKRLIEPEAADVDITKEEILVSVGRGIQDKDSIEIVQELADAIGCPLSASRPIIDLGWMPKSRQVGKSGVTVKPKIYLAIGISGAPEHVQGMKDAATIVAINSDPKAPIFDVAHYGVTADLFDLVPVLTEKVKEAKG
jgi:electron transfer flavoprotein alpha subunit